MEARAEPDFTAYQERNKEEKEKKNFCLTREKRKEVDDVLLPGLMSSRTPNKSAQGLLQSQTEAEERFHSFHTSYRKIRNGKRRDAYLHWTAKHAGALCLIWKTKQFAPQEWECL